MTMHDNKLYTQMKAETLKTMKCKPCEGGVPPLKELELLDYMKGIGSEWRLTRNEKISRTFSFVNFRHTMDFVNKVAELAEEEGHHPVMHVQYARLDIELWTHAIGGLSENDFILAAKIDALMMVQG